MLNVYLFLVCCCVSLFGAEMSMVRISCEGEALGSHVRVNGKVKGECPLDIQVNTGTVTIQATKTLGVGKTRDFSQEFFVGEGVIKKVDIVLGEVMLTPEGKKVEEERKRLEKEAYERKRMEEDRSLSQRFSLVNFGSEVLDRETGLIWKRCYEGQSWNAKACVGSRITDDARGMLQKLESMSDGTPKSWRVPTLHELGSLRECNPADRSDVVIKNGKEISLHCPINLPLSVFPIERSVKVWTSSESYNSTKEFTFLYMIDLSTGGVFHSMVSEYILTPMAGFLLVRSR